jgi:hypothetical protein
MEEMSISMMIETRILRLANNAEFSAQIFRVVSEITELWGWRDFEIN